jgi:hypothetical protein
MAINMNPVRQVVQLDNEGYHATSTDNDLLTQIVAKGGKATGLRAVLASNDHATDRAWIQSPGSTAGRGICLVAGDSVLLVGVDTTLRYQGQLTCGLIY